ncbi:MAG: 3-isopropylmalate dehydratase large subunit [Ignisphaera sp.]|nr:3-isopropylmalate dehydratase large subunit [Ignisphaera sp.]MCX8167610.1 3-isopropylmalate dehydratase large subunit [Ignisphaera sp.]MDW8086188.1 3-isopropylmalate dehydratase large subunit [Ignisphaera sp.]
MGLIDRIVSRSLQKDVSPGEIAIVKVDVVYAQDGTAPLIIDVIENELGMGKLAAADRSYLFIDHLAPAPHIAAASAHKRMRRFAEKYGVRLFDAGYGISHQVVVEDGIVRPGMVAVGADSHTPTVGAIGAYATGIGSTDAAIAMVYGELWLRIPETVKIVLSGPIPKGVYGKDIILYMVGEFKTDGMIGKSVEFHGNALKNLTIDSRMTITNMCTEMSAESAIIPVDEVVLRWLDEHGYSIARKVDGEDLGEYVDVIPVEVSRLEPMVAAPPDVDNVATVGEVEGMEVDQVFIGSCTNGRLEDIEVAARIIKNKKISKRVRCIVSPASRRVYRDALKMGYVDVLIEAGCIVAPPTCGPCVGAHMGLLAEGEVAIATTNRNFMGRMGHRESRVYLASPATAAASAIEGRIADPRKYLS